jgi:sirohydrochlorin cobaltochelatase
MKTAVIILGHGSRSGKADEQIKHVAAEVRKSIGSAIVKHAFLQYMKPGAEEVLEQCIRLGANKIVIVPFFLQPGTHVIKHIPELREKVKKLHPDVDIKVTDFAGSHPLMIDIVLGLLRRNER